MALHWKSKILIGRLPLIHIAIGRNDRGEKEPAIGIVAVGRRAFGVVAVGQFAAGFITIAQFGVGLVAGIGQFMAGMAVLAQFALGPLAAVGQFALGWFSIGQIAFGYMGVRQAGWHRVNRNWLAELEIDWGAAASFLLRNMELLIGGFLGFIIVFVILPAVVPMIKNSISTQWLEIKTRLGMVRLEEVLALVTRVEDTGMTVNQNPVVVIHLEYIPRNGQKTSVTLKTTVSRLEASNIQAGSHITVRYDPKKPGKPLL